MSKAMDQFVARLEERFAGVQGLRIEPCKVTSISPLTVTIGGATGVLGVPVGVVYTVGTVNNALALSTGKSKPLIFPIGFGSSGGGGTSYTRATATIASGGTGTLTLHQSFRVLWAQSSGAGRLRLYRSSADRTADASRPPGFPPSNAGLVLAEFRWTAAGLWWSTGLVNNLAAAGTTVYYNVTEGAPSIDICWIGAD